MVACECKEYDTKGIRGRGTGQSPFLLELLRRRHGVASSWRFDAMRIHETPRRGHEGRASGVVFFSTAAAFFLVSGDCGARLPAPRRGNDALYSRAYFFRRRDRGRPGVEPPSSGRWLQRPSRQAGPAGEPRVLHGLVGLFSFRPDIFHPWVNGYGNYWNIPIPAYPMGEGFGPFTYP